MDLRFCYTGKGPILYVLRITFYESAFVVAYDLERSAVLSYGALRFLLFGVLLAVLLPAAGAVPQPGNPSLGSGSNSADSIASAQSLDSVSAQSGWSTPVN